MQKIGSKIIIITTVACIAAYIGIFVGRVSVDSPFDRSANNIQKEDSRYTVDLNSADYDSLIELPGMTSELAEEIVAYRQKYGDFIAVKELLNLKNMTNAIYDQMKDYLTIGGAQ